MKKKPTIFVDFYCLLKDPSDSQKRPNGNQAEEEDCKTVGMSNWNNQINNKFKFRDYRYIINPS
jgi:hypothetical protein